MSSERFRFRESSTSDVGSPEGEGMTVEDELRLEFGVFGLDSVSGTRKGLTVSTFSCPCSAAGGVGERVLRTVLTSPLVALIRGFDTAMFAVGAVNETRG